jgi:hypothetical protein
VKRFRSRAQAENWQLRRSKSPFFRGYRGEFEIMNKHPDFDLSSLTGHYIFNVSFSNTTTTFSSIGPRDRPREGVKDGAGITIECDVEFNGMKIHDRGSLISLLDKVYQVCWIDADFDLHITFTSGEKLIARRKTNGFESFNIEIDLDPTNSIVI